MKFIKFAACLIAGMISAVPAHAQNTTLVTVPKGGTGITSATAYGILYGNGVAPLGVIAAGSNGQVLIGQSSAAAQFKTITGDVTFSNAGVVAIGANKVTDSILRQSGALSLVGRSANSTGNVADIAASAGSSCAFRESGNTVGCGTLATAAYAANSVTNAKLATMANGTTKCRTTAGTGDPEDCTALQIRSLLSLVVGTNVQAWDTDLDCIAAISTTGVITRTGAGTCAVRTVTAPAAGITVSNGDGVSGNPTLALANDLAALEGLSGTGIARRTGTDAWSVGTAVANSELATMANNTVKGNVSGSSGAPSDLTASQLTALVNVMVGDTGSGGTKGLCPAPGAGDAAAGKFCKADGTWAVPPGTGGGGSLSDTDRQNILLDRAYQSKLFGGYRRFINAFADGYKASDGVGSITSGSVNTTSGFVAPTSSAGSDQTATHTGSTASGNTASASSELAGGFQAWRAFDKVTGGSAGAGTWIANSVTTGWLQYQFGSAKTIASYTLTSPNGFATRMANAWTLKGSNTGSFAGEETTLDTRSGETSWTSGGQTRTYSVSSPASFSYYRLTVTANNGDGTYLEIDEMTLISAGTANNMTLVTTAQTADSSVSNGRVLLEIDNSAAPALNTDLTAEVTCNNGTNWASATLSAVTSYSQSGRKVVETADTACGASGTTFAARVKTLNNKNVPIYGLSLTVH